MKLQSTFRGSLSVLVVASLFFALLAVSVMAQEEEFDEYWGNRLGIPMEAWQATASVNADDAKKGIDGDTGTAWTASTKAGDYYQVDLGDVYKVNRLEWYTDGTLHEGWGDPAKKDAYPQRFRIEVSLDGDNWTTVVDQDGKGAFEAGDHLLQAIWKPVAARYVRIVQTADQETALNLSQLLISSEGQSVGVTILNYYYFPNVLLVAAGTEVEWIQLDVDPHTVTQGKPEDEEEDRLFNSSVDWSTMELGERFSFTFEAEHAGELIRYFCIPHPENMIAWVKVVNLN